MKEWERFTRTITPADIRPEIAAAIHEHIKYYNLGPILDDYLICIETFSVKKKKGLFSLFGSNKTRIDAAVVTPRWLVIGTGGKKPESGAALSVQLKEADVIDHRDHPGYALLPDTGLHVSGVFTGRVGRHGSQRVSCYLGLGEEPAAREFKDTLLRGLENNRT